MTPVPVVLVPLKEVSSVALPWILACNKVVAEHQIHATSLCLTQLIQIVDVEFKSVLTDITKLVLYYMGGGIMWLDDAQSNYQAYARDNVG